MFLYQTLSLHMGFSAFSEANTHASGCCPTSSIQFRSSLAVCDGMPTVLFDDVVLGSSISPRAQTAESLHGVAVFQLARAKPAKRIQFT
jgi:hypothetical protein